MKIHLVNVGDSLISIGVRKVSAYMRTLNPDTTISYIPMDSVRSLRHLILPKCAPELDGQAEAHQMAEPIADADIVAFSSMTHVAEQTKAIIAEVRAINPRAYILWGGIHPIMDPEDAIRHADAICTGEGEFAFAEFFDAFRNGHDYTGARNFWFNRQGNIIRNGFLPLMTSADMDALPLPTYEDHELIYDRNRQVYTPATRWHYIDHMRLEYHTIWSIGCPFKCTYCGNTKFLENDRGYSKLRHPGARWLMNEINAARRIHPHISSVVFNDDSFLALPKKTLEEFAALYKDEVGLPFCVLGVIPNYVRKDKLEILLAAGLNRVRMGIQSGSQRILDFYKRPSPPKKVLEACNILGLYSKYMMPPVYDIIVDNPIETRQDVMDTLELAYKMARPFTFNIYSLRLMPNTALTRQFEKLGISADEMATRTYRRLAPTFANCLLVLLACVRPPRWLFDRLLRRVRANSEEQRMYPTLAIVLRLVFLGKLAGGRIRRMDFCSIPGRLTWFLWRIGLVGLANRRMLRRLRRAGSPARSEGSEARHPGLSSLTISAVHKT